VGSKVGSEVGTTVGSEVGTTASATAVGGVPLLAGSDSVFEAEVGAGTSALAQAREAARRAEAAKTRANALMSSSFLEDFWLLTFSIKKVVASGDPIQPVKIIPPKSNSVNYKL
jgi:hypothetical protein